MSSGSKKSPSNGFEKTLTSEEEQTKVSATCMLLLFGSWKCYCYCGKKSLLSFFFFFQCLQIKEVRRLTGQLPDKLSIYCSDACIARYLRARNWHVKKATKMLKASLKWRLEYKPEEIRWVSVMSLRNRSSNGWVC